MDQITSTPTRFSSSGALTPVDSQPNEEDLLRAQVESLRARLVAEGDVRKEEARQQARSAEYYQAKLKEAQQARDIAEASLEHARKVIKDEQDAAHAAVQRTTATAIAATAATHLRRTH
mgnify:CR=1 FL=1